MELEKQVTSLELSIRLKELGVKQESLFWWLFIRDTKNVNFKEYKDNDFTSEGSVYYGRQAESYKRSYEDAWEYSAFTVAELGEMLPACTDTHYFKHQKGKEDGRWRIYSVRNGEAISNYWIEDDTEANARAKMLVYLLENKLI